MKGIAVGLNKGFITTKITKPRERAVLRSVKKQYLRSIKGPEE